MGRGFAPLEKAGAGKDALAHSRIGASLAEIRGDGPVEKRGNKLVPVSDRCPLVGYIATGATTLGASYSAVTWERYEGDSQDAVWTSASTATIGTMGYYDLSADLEITYTGGAGTVSAKWQRNSADDIGGARSHSALGSHLAQTHVREPMTRLNPGDTVRLLATTDGLTTYTINESRCSIRLVKEITSMPNTVGYGSTITCGPIGETWLIRDTASSAIAGTLTNVATVTDCKPGYYQGEYRGVYQTTATTTGAGWAIDFTGTATGAAVRVLATTGTGAATNAASGAAADATGDLYEAQSSRTINGTLIGATTVSVDAADTDTDVLVTFRFTVTAIGNFSIMQRAEGALSSSARPNSLLILRKLS